MANYLDPFVKNYVAGEDISTLNSLVEVINEKVYAGGKAVKLINSATLPTMVQSFTKVYKNIYVVTYQVSVDTGAMARCVKIGDDGVVTLGPEYKFTTRIYSPNIAMINAVPVGELKIALLFNTYYATLAFLKIDKDTLVISKATDNLTISTDVCDNLNICEVDKDNNLYKIMFKSSTHSYLMGCIVKLDTVKSLKGGAETHSVSFYLAVQETSFYSYDDIKYFHKDFMIIYNPNSRKSSIYYMSPTTLNYGEAIANSAYGAVSICDDIMLVMPVLNTDGRSEGTITMYRLNSDNSITDLGTTNILYPGNIICNHTKNGFSIITGGKRKTTSGVLDNINVMTTYEITVDNVINMIDKTSGLDLPQTINGACQHNDDEIALFMYSTTGVAAFYKTKASFNKGSFIGYNKAVGIKGSTLPIKLVDVVR